MRKALAVMILSLLPAVAAFAQQNRTESRAFTYTLNPGGSSWLGVSVDEVTSENLSRLKLKDERGVEVVTVLPDSPAEKAGLKDHDVILDYDGQRIMSSTQLKRMISETPAGRAVKLLVSRDGVTQTLSATIGERRNPPGVAVFRDGEPIMIPPMPPMPPMPRRPETPRTPRAAAPPTPEFFGQWFGSSQPRLGIEGEPVGKQLGEYFGVPNGEGVLVRNVTKDSPAEKAGIKAGDVITRIGDRAVEDLDDVRRAVRDRESLPVVLYRNKSQMTVTVKIDAPARPGSRI